MVPILLLSEVEPAERAHHAHRPQPRRARPLPCGFPERTGIAILDGYGSTETNS